MTEPTDPNLPPRAEMLRAMLACDPAYEGVFYTAVRTTRIFCRPTCPARKPKPENVEFHASAEAALAAGFRPCKRCRPLQLPADTPDWVARILARAETAPAQRWSDAQVLALGEDPVRLRRWCHRHFGMTFHAWLRARRLGAALGSLLDGDSIEGAAYEHGYASSSGFRDAFRAAFSTTPGRGRDACMLLFRRIATPLGPMIAMAEPRGLVLLEFLDRPALTGEVQALRHRHGYAVAPGSHPHLAQAERELGEYFAGARQDFQVPVWTPGSDFEQAVWARLREVPFGATCSYAEIAAGVGRPGAARAVGTANGRNRLAIVVPCHRVVGADGSLTGYGGGMARKAFLLRLERDVLACRNATAPTALGADAPASVAGD